MLTQKQVKDIKEHLDKAQNPLFFFDNDPDGLCSFLLLQRYLGRGKGVPVKSFPDLSENYFRKIEELNPDYIFILDKPRVSQEFFKRINQVNLPIVWIDHHEINKEDIPDFVNYYNPLFNTPAKSEPVTALCYQLTNRKKDLWLAVAGCVSDKFFPDFYSDFKKTYPDLSVNSKDAFDIVYKSDIGKISRIFSFALKDRTTNVMRMLKFLGEAETPYEVLEEGKKNSLMYDRFNFIERKFEKLLKKAKMIERDSDNILFFQYAGDLSVSSDLANKLGYLFPKKIVVVVYAIGIKANISVRGKKIRKLVLKAIEGLENATGGGHEDAVGGRVRLEDLEKFRENLEKAAGK